MIKETSKPQIDDFSNYRTGFSYGSGRVVLSNDDSLSFEEKRSIERSTRYTYEIYATKIKNLEKATERRKVPEEEVNNSPIDVQFPYKWYNSFTENQLRELFERYYVPGYESFCLAIMPENTSGLPLYKFTIPDHLIYHDPQYDSRTNANFGVDHYFEKLIDTIRGYGNNCISKGAFITFIRKIRSLTERVYLKKPMRKTDCLALNNLIQELPDDKTISTDILSMMLNSMSEDFIKNKLFSRCVLCGNHFLYLQGKKHCSVSCRQKAYYQRHPELKDKSKIRMKELRILYKEHGIK